MVGREIPVDVGFGGSVTLTASQEKAVKTLVTELTKMRKEYEALRKVKKELKAIDKVEKDTEVELSKHFRYKKEALLQIKRVYQEIGQAKKDKKKDDEAELTNLDLFNKRYSWMLIAFTAIKEIFGVIGKDSKVVNHIFDLVGAAVGFIVDMLLMDFLPIMVRVVEVLFQVGAWVSRLPWQIKLMILILIALGAALAAVYSIAIMEGLAKLALSVAGVGVEAAAAGVKVTALKSLIGGLGVLTITAVVAWAMTQPEVKDPLYDTGEKAGDWLTDLIGDENRKKLVGAAEEIGKPLLGFTMAINKLFSGDVTGAAKALALTGVSTAETFMSGGLSRVTGAPGTNELNKDLTAWKAKEFAAHEFRAAGAGKEPGAQVSVTINGTLFRSEEDLYRAVMSRISTDINSRAVRG